MIRLSLSFFSVTDYGLKTWLLCAAWFALSVSSQIASAAEAPYPQRPLRLIIPQATGGGSDTIGRFVTQRLTENLGQPFVVDNRPGAAGMLGAELVKQATPDGYTLLLCAIDTITAPIVSRRAPYDALRDFSPVTQLTQSPNVWLVNLSFSAQSMKDLVELAKAKPSQIDYASSGVGSMQHLGGELFNRMAGIQLSHVPYKGGPPGLVDVLGGRVPVIVSGFQGALPYIKAGKLRALAVTTPKRAPAIPDVPTVAESTGLNDYAAINWQGLLFPADTPRPPAERIAGEVVKLMKLADVRTRLETLGYEPVANTPTQMAAVMATEKKRWTEIIKAANITADMVAAKRTKAQAPAGYRLTTSIMIDPGGSWGSLVRAGEVVRFIDLEGQQAVDFLCYNALDTRDRYNAANTMKMAQNVFINVGTVLYGEYATQLMKVTRSSSPNHDTIGGCCSVEMNFLRYGRRTHSCRANFIHELSKFKMGEADIAANVNFFMSVPLGPDWHMAISDSPSKAGDFVDVEALTDVIAVISNCPQKYNPACGYNPTPVQIETYTRKK
ncbi:MAG: tripartite tricarboxylate transporter substrate-binding protein [Pseudomonadota bacterium]